MEILEKRGGSGPPLVQRQFLNSRLQWPRGGIAVEGTGIIPTGDNRALTTRPNLDDASTRQQVRLDTLRVNGDVRDVTGLAAPGTDSGRGGGDGFSGSERPTNAQAPSFIALPMPAAGDQPALESPTSTGIRRDLVGCCSVGCGCHCRSQCASAGSAVPTIR